VEASEGNRVQMEEVAGQQSLRLSAQERSPGCVHGPRSRPTPSGAQDPLHGRCADAVTEPAELAVDSAITPGGVLPGQSQYQIADVLAGAGPAGPVRVRPFAGDQAAVPGQQGAGRDEPA